MMPSPQPNRSESDSGAGTRAWPRLLVVLGAIAWFVVAAALFRIGVDLGTALAGGPERAGQNVVRQPLATAAAGRLVPATMRSTLVSIAGDIAQCPELEPARQTAALIQGSGGLVMTAGDNAYPDGSADQFQRCYEPTWGGLLERTRPAPGNHDYGTPGAAGYFDYFGERAGPAGRGYYAFQAGTWQVIVLNSQLCVAQGCGPQSEQHAWLAEELAARRAACTLAVAHHPRFSSGYHGDNPEVSPLLELLYRAGTDVMVSGHDHDYERLAPTRPDGRSDEMHGIRQFVVGTGGSQLRPRGSKITPSSVVFDASSHGILRLRLYQDSYDWEFRSIDGGSFRDAGSGRCHARP